MAGGETVATRPGKLLALTSLVLQTPRGLVVRFFDADDCRTRLFVHTDSGRAWIADSVESVVQELGTDLDTAGVRLRDCFQLRCSSTAANNSEELPGDLDFLVHLRTSDQVTTLGIERLPGSLAPFQVSTARQKLDQFAQVAAVRMRAHEASSSQKLRFTLSSLDGKFTLAKPESVPTRSSNNFCIELQRVATDASAGGTETATDRRGMTQPALAFTIDVDTMNLERECFRSIWTSRELAWLRPHGEHCLSAEPKDSRWVSIAPFGIIWHRVAMLQLYWPRKLPIQLRGFAIGGKSLDGQWYGLGTYHSICFWREERPLACIEKKQTSPKSKPHWQVYLAEPSVEAPAVFSIQWRERSRDSACFLQLCCPSNGARPADQGVALYLGLEKPQSRLVLKHRPRQWELFELCVPDWNETSSAIIFKSKSVADAELAPGQRTAEYTYFASARRLLDEINQAHQLGPENKQRTEQVQEMARRRNAIMDKVAAALALRDSQISARTDTSHRARPEQSSPDHRTQRDSEISTKTDTSHRARPEQSSPDPQATSRTAAATNSSGAESDEQPQLVQSGVTAADQRSNLQCTQCHQTIVGEYVRALSKCYHPACFTCSICRRPLAPAAKFRTSLGNPLCETCYAQHIAPRCARCKAAITDLVVTAMERKWHRECLRCVRCGQPLCDENSPDSSTFYLYIGQPDKPHCELCVRGERRKKDGPRPFLGSGSLALTDPSRRHL
jgi:hypothetical protein